MTAADEPGVVADVVLKAAGRLARKSGTQPVPAHDVCDGFADLRLPA